MKKTIWANVACATLLCATAAGCSEETAIAGGEDAGYIALNLNFDPNPVKGPRGDRSRAATAYEITKEDLTLTLTHSSGALAPLVFNKEKPFGSEQRVNTGSYTLEANYGTGESEGWDTPYYYGSQTLTVKNEATTPVNLPVKLANAIVNVSLTDNFTSYMSDYTVTVTSPSATKYVWAKDETRRLYVQPGEVMISIEFTKPNGKTATAHVDPFNAEACHQYNVNIDAETGSMTLGGEAIEVKIDDTITEKEVLLDISDANLPNLAAAPEVTLSDGFTAGMEINLVSGSSYAGGQLKATVVARGIISKAVLNISSAYLKSKGWPESVDLCNAGAAQALLDNSGIVTRGFTGSRQVFGVVEFDRFLPNVLYLDGADNKSTFSLTVTDEQGKETTTGLFTLNVEKLTLDILPGSAVTDYGKAILNVKYNGGDMADVKFSIKNDRGTWSSLKVESVAPGSEAGTYELVVTSDYITDKSVPVKAECANIASEEFTLKAPDLRIEGEANAFATHAYATVEFLSDDAANARNEVVIEASANGGAYAPVSTTLESSTFAARSSRAGDKTAVYHITGLSANTTYSFRARIASLGEVSLGSTLTTEEATQLPNAGMEEWEIQPGGSKYWWKSYLGNASTTPWGSMNLITTSAGGSSTNMFKHDGCAYVARSGTDRTDDNKSGLYAAVIKTIGWGYSDANGGMNAKNLTVGSLHLGTTPNVGSEPVYGMNFNSRPMSLKFWYKYVPRNNADFGYVEVWIKDSADKIIATTNKNIKSVSDYTEMRVDLAYSVYAEKAAKICVIFRSSNNPDCQTISNANLSKPDFGNLSDGKYEGAILTIDDIELIY